MEAAVLTEAQLDAAKRVFPSGSQKVRRLTACEPGEHHVHTPIHPLCSKKAPCNRHLQLFFGIKGLEREADHPPLSCAGVQNILFYKHLSFPFLVPGL